MQKELIEVIRSWRIIHLLAVSPLRIRYARSKLGQLWLTLSNCVFIAVTGIIWSMIWHMRIGQYLPYVGVGHVLFLLFAQTVNESSGVLIADSRLYINEYRSFLTSIAAHVYRNVVVFIHNSPVILILLFFFPVASNLLSVAALCSFLASLLIIFFMAIAVALVCARFRDLIQIVGILMQICFLLSPVMWNLHLLPQKARTALLLVNPFAAMLDCVRSPLLAQPAELVSVISLLGWLLVSALVAWLAHRLLARRLIYWLI